MKILLADDHELVRDTISAFLERESDVEVDAVGCFADAENRLRENGPYDLVLLDVFMPGMNELDGLARAIALSGGRPVALISGAASRAVAEAALAAGAAGFLPKTMSARSLIHAVRFMVAGEQYAPIAFITGQTQQAVHPMAEQLSEREREVLEGLCRGLANKEIAKELALREVTVKLHVKTLCRKLEARNRTHAAMIAKDAGFC